MSAAFDRAEYSLEQGTIVIALVIGGAALASLGILRSTRAAFTSMPRVVAISCVAGGLAVVAFGVALLFMAPAAEHADVSPAARATLEPVRPGDTRDGPKETIKGVVRDQRDATVKDIRVTLIPLFEADGVKERKTRTNDDGRFTFDDVEVNPGSPWAVEASYDGARFPSETLRSARDVEIRVAQTTKDDDDLVVTVESLAVVGDEEGVQALHALNVANTGDRAYVGPLELPLLRGAAAIQEGTYLDRRYLELAHGSMVSTKPIGPGAVDITYTYVTQMSKDGIAFARSLQIRTRRYDLLVGGDLELASPRGLRAGGKVELGVRDEERTYERYSARDLEPGTDVAGRISTAEGTDLVRIGVPIAAGLAALALIAFPLVRRRRRTDVAAPDPAPAAQTS